MLVTLRQQPIAVGTRLPLSSRPAPAREDGRRLRARKDAPAVLELK